MDLRFQMKAMDLLMKLAKDEGEKLVPKEFVPEKPEFKEVPSRLPFREALPEDEGVRSGDLADLICRLSDEETADPHTLIVIRNGKVITKCAWSPYRLDRWHISHSMCKSVVSMAVGIALSEGLFTLDEKIADIFADKLPTFPMFPSKNIKLITIEHLLTMSSGLMFNEAGAVCERDWLKCCMSSDTIFTPGTDFNYNSLNTYLLSAIIMRRSGERISDYLKTRLFDPLGITNFYWERCPMGIEKGGWGLYMMPMDYAKLGQLYLQKGKIGGQQLVPAEWIEKSSSKLIFKESGICEYGYGYQIWQGKEGCGYLFNGMFGQNVFVFPERNMVIAMTSGGENLFPKSRVFDIITDYIRDDGNFTVNPNPKEIKAAQARLSKTIAALRYKEAIPEEKAPTFSEMLISLIAPKRDVNTPAAMALDGKVCTFPANTTGLLPLLMQVLHANYSEGIDSVRFSFKDGRLYAEFHEGNNTDKIPVPFDGAEYIKLTRRGEIYDVGVVGGFSQNEDGIPVLKIKLCFVETSCSRVIKFFFKRDKVVMRISEAPLLYSALSQVIEMVMPSATEQTQKSVLAITENEFVEYKLTRMIEPELFGSIA